MIDLLRYTTYRRNGGDQRHLAEVARDFVFIRVTAPRLMQLLSGGHFFSLAALK